MADRRPDSYFNCDIFGARLHLIGAKSLKVRKWAYDRMILYAPESTGQIVDMLKLRR